MVNKPPVSVIVVTFNGQQYISECLSALLSSDYPSLEIIVVDNASSDNTLKELEKYGGKITIIKNIKNLGFAAGNNVGIKKSHGEIIILINQDAIVKKNSINELVNSFTKDEKVMISGSKILYPNSRKIQSAGGILQKNGLTNHIGYGQEDTGQFDTMREVDYVTGAAMGIRKTLFQKTGLLGEVYRPAYFEELEKCIQAKKLKYKIVYQPKSEVFHYESTTFEALSRTFLKHYHTNRFRFIYRNYNLKEFLFKFVPVELKWFFSHCPPSDRGLVIRSHLTALFNH